MALFQGMIGLGVASASVRLEESRTRRSGPRRCVGPHEGLRSGHDPKQVFGNALIAEVLIHAFHVAFYRFVADSGYESASTSSA
jgi:hypothetical protein